MQGVPFQTHPAFFIYENTNKLQATSMNQSNTITDFSSMGQAYVEFLEKQGRHSSAHIYRNALHSFHEFAQCSHVQFESINAELLKSYELHLQKNGASANTISTYLRMLRSIYNRGVDAQIAPFQPRLFHKVYTGIDSHHKRALNVAQLHLLLYSEVDTDELKHTQLTARAIFQLCGIPFADFVRLRQENIQGAVLSYRRKKTGIAVNIELLPCIRQTLDQLTGKGSTTSSRCYLSGILPADVDTYDSPTRHKLYTSALRRFNRHLNQLADQVGLNLHISSYTLRHSWATLAKHQGSPVEAISEMLGHTSIKTTQIYLKGFELPTLTKVNQRNCESVAQGFLL